MPCLEEKDLTELADKHVTSQKSVIRRLRKRMAELESEVSDLSRRGIAEDDPQFKNRYDALKHLKLELNGEVPDGRGLRFRRDAAKKTAEERADVMAELYRNRKHYVFHDTTKKTNEPRTASMFGYPTIQEMIDRGYQDIADEMMVRAASLLQSRSDGRNPVDFLNTEGLNVKQAQANLIEHHHIFNNVFVDDNGRVEFKTFKIYADSSGKLTMNIIPSYWNAEKHGRNTQFIGLMDGMHAGEDPVTHLHYYRFTDDESKTIKAKISKDTKQIVADALKRKLRLEDQLGDLEFRRRNPERYEADLLERIQKADLDLSDRKAAAKGLISKAKSKLSGDELTRREAYDSKKREISQLQKKLTEHRTLSGLKKEVVAIESQIADLQSQIGAINLRRLPKADRPAEKARRKKLKDQVEAVKETLKSQQKLMRTKGDIDTLIASTRKKLSEAEQLADLTPEKAVEMFEEENGFFSFDKGFAEKSDHSVYRPIMNEEINRFYVRQTLEYLEQKHGDNYLEELEKLGESRRRSNLLERLGALVDKLPEAVI